MENKDKPTESFPQDFKVVETSAAANSPTPPTTAPLLKPHHIRSANAWASFGLMMALTGLFGTWASPPTLPGGGWAQSLLMALTVWFLLRGGFGAVQRTGAKTPPALGGVLLLFGVLRLAVRDELPLLGLGSAEGVLDVSGAIMTTFGGVIALLGQTLGAKKDAKLPPRGEPLAVDTQFSCSLLAYLMILFGMLMHWTEAERGVDNLFGLITLLSVLMLVWASWVGMWKLWQMPLVTGKLGLLLFLAPFEAILLGMMGLKRLAFKHHADFDPDSPGLVVSAIHSEFLELDFALYAGGPFLVILGSSLAMYLLFSGAKQAVASGKERKAQEVAARKTSRSKRKK